VNNLRKDVIGSAVLYLFLALTIFVSVNVSASSEMEGGKSTDGVLLLAEASSCSDKCKAAKKRCMAQHTRTNSHGVKLVTPDGAKRCWAAYHRCNSYCK
jgi:hypothetical protein